MRRQITPGEFGALIRWAQQYRLEGHSEITSAVLACRAQSISDDWAAPLIGFLNDSPTIAEAWAERMTNENLDRAYARTSAIRDRIGALSDE